LNKRTLDLPNSAVGSSSSVSANRNGRLVSRFDETVTTPNQLRWNPLPMPEAETDFIDGIVTMAGCGDSFSQTGNRRSHFRCNKNMTDRFFYNADGEMLVVAEKNRVRFLTELGI
jgi:homogentisate 1,2-dioxygenase